MTAGQVILALLLSCAAILTGCGESPDPTPTPLPPPELPKVLGG